MAVDAYEKTLSCATPTMKNEPRNWTDATVRSGEMARHARGPSVNNGFGKRNRSHPFREWPFRAQISPPRVTAFRPRSITNRLPDSDQGKLKNDQTSAGSVIWPIAMVPGINQASAVKSNYAQNPGASLSTAPHHWDARCRNHVGPLREHCQYNKK
jgi:hypothetical protein